MERVPFHHREMGISIQYHVMLIRESNDQILMRCYINRDYWGQIPNVNSVCMR